MESLRFVLKFLQGPLMDIQQLPLYCVVLNMDAPYRPGWVPAAQSLLQSRGHKMFVVSVAVASPFVRGSLSGKHRSYLRDISCHIRPDHLVGYWSTLVPVRNFFERAQKLSGYMSAFPGPAHLF